MTTVADILASIEAIAPTYCAFGFDRIGLQIGDPDATVTRALLALDSNYTLLASAEKAGAELLITHHPLIWEPMKTLTSRGHVERLVLAIAGQRRSLIACHTNWDAVRGGLNDFLAEQLGLRNIQSFGSAPPLDMFKLITFVPATAADALLDALAQAGAGTIGEYQRCAFTNEGTGTYEATANANPTIGNPGERTSTPETRLEMLVPGPARARVEKALRENHPYEEPAYDWVQLAAGQAEPIGRIGNLDQPVPLIEFRDYIDRTLKTRSLVWGEANRPIRRVAVVGGAAPDEWRAARDAGADAFITGEIPHHVSKEGEEEGLAMIAAGHFATESPSMVRLAELLSKRHPDVVFQYDPPASGRAGRPLD